jgi:hypothetical protein
VRIEHAKPRLFLEFCILASEVGSPGSDVRVKFLQSSFAGQLPAAFKPRRDEPEARACPTAEQRQLKKVDAFRLDVIEM